MVNQCITKFIGIQEKINDEIRDGKIVSRFGITERRLKLYDPDYHKPIEILDIQKAKDIYRHYYADPMRLDCLKSFDLCFELFSMAYHGNISFAVLSLQKFLNQLNNNQEFWKDVDVDGNVTDRTLEAIVKCSNKSLEIRKTNGDRIGGFMIKKLIIFLRAQHTLAILALNAKGKISYKYFDGWTSYRELQVSK